MGNTKNPSTYPHVQSIRDYPTQQSVKLLWDQHHQNRAEIDDLQVQLKAAQATITSQAASISALQKQMTQAIITSGSPLQKTAVTQTPGGTTPGGGGTPPSPPPPTLKPAPDEAIFKNIAAVTATDFPWLFAVFPTDQQATDAAVEYLRRVIWRINNAGYLSGRQQNPSGAISNDKLTVFDQGNWYAYDIMSLGYAGTATIPNWSQVGSPVYVVDPGIPSP